MLQGWTGSILGVGVLYIANYDNSFAGGSGNNLTLSGSYEAA